jgi:hypothetical protein
MLPIGGDGAIVDDGCCQYKFFTLKIVKIAIQQ